MLPEMMAVFRDKIHRSVEKNRFQKEKKKKKKKPVKMQSTALLDTFQDIADKHTITFKPSVSGTGR